MTSLTSTRAGRLVPSGEAEARPFEFGAPVPLGDEELTSLLVVHADVGARLALLWTELLRVECQIVPSMVEPMARDVLDVQAPGSAHHCLIEIEPMPGAAVLTVPGPLALILVDLLLGGSGRPAGGIRLLSDIDAELLVGLLSASFDALIEGYSAVGTNAVRIVGSALDPAQLELGERLASLVVVSFDVTVGEQSAVLTLSLDRGAAEALVGGARVLASADGCEPARQLMTEALRDVRVQIVVEFPVTPVRSTELLRLVVGDVIPLSCPADGLLRLRVGTEPLASVRAARSGQRLACQIITTRTSVMPGSIDDTVEQVGGAA